MLFRSDLEKNVIELHQYLFGDYDYVPSNTVKGYSAYIAQDTGKGIGDEQPTGVSEDHYVDGGEAPDGSTAAPNGNADGSSTAAPDGSMNSGTTQDGSTAGSDGTLQDGTTYGQ